MSVIHQTFTRTNDYAVYGHIYALSSINVLNPNMMTSSDEIIFRVTGPLCGNSPVAGEIPSQRPVTRNFDVFWSAPEKNIE